MGRNYAGILGLLAFSATLLRGVLASESSDAVLLTSVVMLYAFAAVGWLVGSIAQTTVEDSVRTRFAAELKAAHASEKR